jgi:hypothetical protein
MLPMPNATKQVLAAVAVSLLVIGCPKSEITMIGQPRSELPQGCPVTVFPTTMPDYKTTNIATVQTECQMYGRATCLEQLKHDTCKLGGDTVYAINERKGATGNILMAATIALRSEGPAPQLAAATCSPPCSPGYLCQGTTCMALCNPACVAGTHCADDRTCQPDAPAAK